MCAASEVEIGGSLLPVEDLVCNTTAMGTANAAKCVDATLLTPLKQCHDRGSYGGKGQACKGLCRVQGAVVARAYVYARETCGSAAAMVKDDICASLRARLDLLCDVRTQSLQIIIIMIIINMLMPVQQIVLHI
jgi:hypothetical protein